VIFKIAACHSALCHGEDDADIASATIDPATAMQHPSTVASSNPALGGHGTLDRLHARRFPGYRSLGRATAPMN